MFFDTTANGRPCRSRWPRIALTAAGLAVALALGGCSMAGTGTGTGQNSEATAFFDDGTVHEINVQFSDEDYRAMLAGYSESSDKDWISATVTIDGSTLENVGLRLKGNSSLQALSGKVGEAAAPADATAAGSSGDGGGTAESPETLPWLIRTDKFVQGQLYQGRTDLVIRGNNTESSLNEALALELTGAANLATLEAAATRFSVNDSPEELRLVIESPDDESWYEETFGAGSIFKAESGGDYSYRGDNAKDYQDVFEQKTGDDDLEPVMKFLDFINNASDEDFTAHLGEYLDVEAFATYLAVQDLVANMDDIDGPGNNSYLRYDPETQRMTVVTWDLNLAFGAMAGAPGGGAMPEGMEPPAGMQPPEGMQMPDGMEFPEGMVPPGEAGAGGPGVAANALSSRFMDDAEFSALYETTLTSLRAELCESGEAQEILDKWTTLLTEQAADLIPTETVEKEAADIAKFLTAEAS